MGYAEHGAQVRPSPRVDGMMGDLTNNISEALSRVENIRTKLRGPSDNKSDKTDLRLVSGLVGQLEEQVERLGQLNMALDSIQTTLGD